MNTLPPATLIKLIMLSYLLATALVGKVYMCAFPYSNFWTQSCTCIRSSSIGAVGGDQTWGGCRLLLILPPFLIAVPSLFTPYRYCTHSLHQFSYLLNPDPFSVGPGGWWRLERLWSHKSSSTKIAVTKVGGNQIHLVPRFSKVVGEASHGSPWVLCLYPV